MAIVEMSLIKINGNVKNIDETMVKCCEGGMFHQERAMSLQEYVKNGETFLEYSSNTGYLRKIIDLAAKLGLGVSQNDFPELEKFKLDDRILDLDKEKKKLDYEDEAIKQAYHNPYKELFVECENIAGMLGIQLNRTTINSNLNMTLSKMKSYLDDVKLKIVYMNEEKMLQEKNLSELKSVAEQLNNIDNANINFDELFSCKYLKIRFGRLPKESYEKLKIFDNDNFVFFPFRLDESYSWCLYVTPCYCHKKIDEMFSSLFFERIRIPVYAHGTPDNTKYYVKSQIIKYTNMLEDTREKINKLKQSIEEDFINIYSKIEFFNDCFENKKYVAIFEDQFYIIGFIPKKYERKFLSQFDSLDDVDITINDPTNDDRLETPVKLKNNRFSEPFEDLVAMYGLPSYKDIDPTVFVSISYTLLFGIMFGDIGQGLVIACIGYILSKIKKINFGRILIRIGFSSACFGVLYGSCFGIEGLFEKYIVKIPHPYGDMILKISNKDTNTLLIGAIFIGVIAIICSMIFNIVLGIKHKKASDYLFGQNGLVGLVFYSSIIIACVGMTILKIDVLTPWFICFFVILPFILIFLKEPLGDKVDGRKIKIHDGIGNFIVENLFELYDILLSFMTNTISFIRVGAFVLSHAGMMMVVMSFVHTMSKGGGIAFLIFGNIFVMAFEGLIVGIQGLRLQFYEMFSRCFDGTGKPFKSV